MNSRQLGILSAVALLIVVGAAWLAMSRTPKVAESDALYPALKGQLDKVSGIKVFKAGDELAIEVVRDGASWKLKQRNDYPADGNKIGSLLIGLENAKLREQKTANADNYSALGVQELSAEGATGARIELSGVEPPVKLIVGKQDTTQRGSFVRRAGESQSWLISEAMTIPLDANGWLKRELLDIGADRIQETAVTPAEGPRYSVHKAARADANFDVTGIPKGRELNSVSAANAAAQTLVGLQLEDVKPAAEFAAAKPAAQAVIRTFDGLELELQGFVVDDKRWITAKPRVDEAQAKRFHMPTTAPSVDPAKPESKEAAAPPAPTPEQSLEAALVKLKSESEALTKRLDGWAFEVANYKYDSLFKPLEQMLKKK